MTTPTRFTGRLPAPLLLALALCAAPVRADGAAESLPTSPTLPSRVLWTSRELSPGGAVPPARAVLGLGPGSERTTAGSTGPGGALAVLALSEAGPRPWIGLLDRADAPLRLLRPGVEARLSEAAALPAGGMVAAGWRPARRDGEEGGGAEPVVVWLLPGGRVRRETALGAAWGASSATPWGTERPPGPRVVRGLRVGAAGEASVLVSAGPEGTAPDGEDEAGDALYRFDRSGYRLWSARTGLHDAALAAGGGSGGDPPVAVGRGAGGFEAVRLDPADGRVRQRLALSGAGSADRAAATTAEPGRLPAAAVAAGVFVVLPAPAGAPPRLRFAAWEGGHRWTAPLPGCGGAALLPEAASGAGGGVTVACFAAGGLRLLGFGEDGAARGGGALAVPPCAGGGGRGAELFALRAGATLLLAARPPDAAPEACSFLLGTGPLGTGAPP